MPKVSPYRGPLEDVRHFVRNGRHDLALAIVEHALERVGERHRIRRPIEPRACLECGTVWTPRHPGALRCSSQCAKRGERRRARERKQGRR